MKFYKYGTQVFYKQLMDILYVNAEEILQKTSLFKSGWTQEKTRSSRSVIWKYPKGAHTVCGKLRSKKPRLEKMATIKNSHRTTKTRKCESWSEDPEPLTLFGRLGSYTGPIWNDVNTFLPEPI